MAAITLPSRITTLADAPPPLPFPREAPPTAPNCARLFFAAILISAAVIFAFSLISAITSALPTYTFNTPSTAVEVSITLVSAGAFLVIAVAAATRKSVTLVFRSAVTLRLPPVKSK